MKKITSFQETKIKQYYQNELSAPEIAQKLNLSLTQIYDSLARQNIQIRNRIQQRKLQFKKTPPSFHFRENLLSAEKELLVAAIMLYFAEGAKTQKTVDIANSDPHILKIFMKFLRTICRIDEKKIRLYLYCFSNQDVNSLKNFWSKELDVPSERFTKPYVRQLSANNSRITEWGVLHIRYSDKRLLEKILLLCSDLSSQFVH